MLFRSLQDRLEKKKQETERCKELRMMLYSDMKEMCIRDSRTIGQLAESDEKLLESHFGKIGNVLWAFEMCIRDSSVYYPEYQDA